MKSKLIKKLRRKSILIKNKQFGNTENANVSIREEEEERLFFSYSLQFKRLFSIFFFIFLITKQKRKVEKLTF
jgi:hypothetical protein